jgi:hypothetical protein
MVRPLRHLIPFVLAGLVLAPAPRARAEQAVWELRPTGLAPTARVSHALAWDSRRGRVVLVAGYDGVTGDPLGDMWGWDGAAWTRAAATAR